MSVMIIKNECPLIYQKLHERFGVEWDDGVIITYSPYVYCKKNLEEYPEKIAHEGVHLEQQKDDPEGWYKKYLSNDFFRLEQEIDAYGQEVRWINKNIKDRNRRFRMINRIASDLSSSMYGNIITKLEALSLFMNIK